MVKLGKRLVFLALLAALVWVGAVLADRQRLDSGLVRVHILANSDSETDQEQKLLVRDALVESLRSGLSQATDAQAAKAYLQEHLPELERLANQVLREAGSENSAVLRLVREAFDTRQYDTFSLPAGVYDALRVEIGSAQGHNWWCVAFPQLCLPAAGEDLQDAAQAGGFSQTLTRTLEGEQGYRVRFFFLDLLGRVENLLHRK